ncbi:MAG: 2-oxo acid dehydrogenase subunit E2 [Eubacteriales bacterium]|nr:2-oxo acid dehydrogenase subunit E2 [Eubacteriales bacterium]
MSIEVVMPRAGLTMVEGTISSWKAAEGASVKKGDVIMEYENEKNIIDYEALASGILHITAQEGETVKVGDPIAVLAESKEEYDQIVSGQAPAAQPKASQDAVPAAPAAAAPAVNRDDVEEVVMPRAGLTMVEGTISSWKVPEGAEIKKGDVIMEYENEKNVIDYEALGSGFLHITAEEGETVKVGDPIAVLAKTKEAYDAVVSGAAPAAASAAAAPAKEAPKAAAAPAASAPKKAGGRISATGLAKKMAKEAGIDIADVPPTGGPNGGRIRGRDVEAYLKAPRVEVQEQAAEEPEIEEVPWTGVRAAIARNMYKSVHDTAQCTMSCEMDFTDLLALREKLKADQDILGVKITVNDLLCRMMSKVFLKHPMANATFDGKTLYEHKHVDLTFAVATEDGLMVPVVKKADTLSLVDLSKKMKDLAVRAREKKLQPSESSGGSVTITNVGMYPIQNATPLLTPPQVMIVGVGQPVKKREILEDGSIGVRSYANIFVTVDHRVIDGMMTGRILQDIKNLIEHPEAILA